MEKSSGKIALLALLASSSMAFAQTSEFTVSKFGSFHHILSTLNDGAYDLEADTTRSTADDDSKKDFINTDAAGSFEGKWKAGNTTTFVNAPGYPTFNAQTGSKDFTFAKIDSLYKAGTPVTVQNSPGTGSKHVWIAKMRGTSTYVIVKFTARIGNNDDCQCPNKGVTSFEYWKMPTTGSPSSVRALLRAEKEKPFRLMQTGGRLVIEKTGQISVEFDALNLLGQSVPAGYRPSR